MALATVEAQRGGMLKLLFIGDIVGRPGRDCVSQRLARIREEHQIDFVIANGENAAAGSGITAAIARSLHEAGVDGVTLGDHVWDQRGWESEITRIARVCRPANLPPSNPGWDHLIISARGFRVAVFTVLGRQFMGLKADCPFRCADRMIEQLRGQADALIVEVHAEATSEKQAMGWYLDGRVTAVIGTHTHVPTADACILPKGTGFICDIGMTGAYKSVLGRDIDAVVAKFVDGMPRRFEVATEDVRLSGVLIEIGPSMACTEKIELLTVRR
ncbi:MAG TPA: TIGR00282 family metallophosphoesterase [Opitutus sp.]|nr:TIGR00282 family metallophosphoesterase [Opitutus sp.]